MEKKFVVNRRTLLAGSAALGGIGLLSACGGGQGGGTSNAESASALGVGEDIAKLISVNPKERAELKEGGELSLASGSIGPDFNPASLNGNTADNAAIISALSPLLTTGLWTSDYEGKKTPNKDFCESFESEMEGETQVLKIKLNSQAKYNDGTPLTPLTALTVPTRRLTRAPFMSGKYFLSWRTSNTSGVCLCSAG